MEKTIAHLSSTALHILDHKNYVYSRSCKGALSFKSRFHLR